MEPPALQTDLPVLVSPEDYLRFEREAEYKHEYYGGQIWPMGDGQEELGEIRAMAGAGFAHNQVCANLTIELGSHLRGKPCKPVGSDQRVHVKNKSSFLYPDVTVVCGKPEFLENKKPDTLTNPTLLVEVLSPSTKDKDRSEKFMLYRQIASLRQYLMLDSETTHAELYTRQDNDHWLFSETRDPAAILDLSSINCQVPLAAVYEGVELTTER